ncbi:hypothetical protein XBKQ1_1080016 [Xenorhabdus bovienii str. kraussei Quebec]|uniref:Uncharacterized protein n=1 Tax=Xenorhabdus bovienii str. kraussei Quebec TaxID=1398203 RepID=A0A077PBY7_XENBV|nr:hypothetical protein XBKQ1_1080016 [Xenorhabdus bovienii str. kraussei Quebec]
MQTLKYISPLKINNTFKNKYPIKNKYVTWIRLISYRLDGKVLIA